MKTARILITLAAVWLTGCATAVVTQADGTRIVHSMIGTNADRVVVTAEGVVYEGANQSDGLRIVGQTTSTVTGIVQAARVQRNADTQSATTDRAAIDGTTARHAESETTARLRETETTRRMMIE